MYIYACIQVLYYVEPLYGFHIICMCTYHYVEPIIIFYNDNYNVQPTGVLSNHLVSGSGILSPLLCVATS